MGDWRPLTLWPFQPIRTDHVQGRTVIGPSIWHHNQKIKTKWRSNVTESGHLYIHNQPKYLAGRHAIQFEPFIVSYTGDGIRCLDQESQSLTCNPAKI